MLTLLLGVALFFCWRSIARLRARVLELEAQSRLDQSAILGDLIARLNRLEGAGQRASRAAATTPAAATAAPPVPVPETPSPAATPLSAQPALVRDPVRPRDEPVPTLPPPVPAPPPASAQPAPPPQVGQPPASTPAARPEPETPAARTPAAARVTSPPVPVPSAPSAPAPTAAAASAATDTDSDSDAWEVVVGTSWLNKIGVLVFVIGVALLVGYSFTHIGPLGRVAIGFALSAAMLGGGVVLERLDRYRTYAYGLIAGGWAGIYFTTFAMHAIPAARVIESEVVAAASLFAVAGGMIGHSLKYRSQTVTALAYVVAYATLALAPLTAFALIASVPLALSILVVAARLQWPGVAVLGVAATYGLFVLRMATFPVAGAAAGGWPLAILGVYWVVFEAADILSARSRGAAAPRMLTVFPLNAMGMIGAASLQLPVNDTATMALFTAIASSAYIASAIVRARLLPGAEPTPPERTAFDTMHAAVAMAAGLAIWSIELRFAGNAQTLALLTEAELLIASGLILGQRPIRMIGGAALALAVAHAAVAVLDPLSAKILAVEGIGVPRPAAGATAIATLTALACLGNREVLRSRGYGAALIEKSYTWMAFGLVSLALAYEVPFAFWAIAAALLSAALLEAGLRRAEVYRYQSYVACAFAIIWVIGRYFLASGVNIFDFRLRPVSEQAIVVLSITTVIAFGMAYRLRLARGALASSDIAGATAAAGVLGAIALTLLPWYALAPVGVAPAWAAIGCAAVALGARGGISGARWHGYVLVALASLRSLVPLAQRAPETIGETIAAAAVIAALYTIGYLGRRAAPRPTADRDSVEWQLATSLGFVATVAFAVFKWRVLPPIAVAPGWAATALVLVVLGVMRGRAGQRWQGYLLAVVGGLRAFDWMDGGPSSLFDYWSPLSVCLAGYLIAAAGRGALGRRPAHADAALEPLEANTLRFLPMAATFLLAAIEANVFPLHHVGLAWAVSAAVFMMAGLWTAAPDLRWQAYALLLAAGVRAAGLILPVEGLGAAAIASTGAVVALMYALGLAGRQQRRAADAQGAEGAEDALRLATLVAATIVLTVLIANETRSTLITLGWGLEGLALMVAGFAARERVLRLSGLGVLLLCILKLFVIDLRELEPLARIMSFVVLGLVLLAVSWTYTRFQEQIRRFL